MPDWRSTGPRMPAFSARCITYRPASMTVTTASDVRCCRHWRPSSRRTGAASGSGRWPPCSCVDISPRSVAEVLSRGDIICTSEKWVLKMLERYTLESSNGIEPTWATLQARIWDRPCKARLSRHKSDSGGKPRLSAVPDGRETQSEPRLKSEWTLAVTAGPTANHAAIVQHLVSMTSQISPLHLCRSQLRRTNVSSSGECYRVPCRSSLEKPVIFL